MCQGREEASASASNSGWRTGSRFLKIWTGSALVKAYADASWPGANAIIVPKSRSPIVKRETGGEHTR